MIGIDKSLVEKAGEEELATYILKNLVHYRNGCAHEADDVAYIAAVLGLRREASRRLEKPAQVGNTIFEVEREVCVDGQWMLRVGKKAAGRILDGRTHDEYPDCA